MSDFAYADADHDSQGCEDIDEPFDHDGCYQPHVRGGEYYDCDGRPL